MNWLERRRQKFLNKSWFGKITDILFVVLILTLLTPGGRVFYQRVLLQIGIFDASFEVSKPLTKPINYADFEFMDIKTQELIDSEELENKVVFINIWATWCPPCKAEIPSLGNLYGRYKNNPEIVFLLASGESTEKLKQFKNDWEPNLPVVKLNSLPKELEFSSLPTTFILNKKGELVHKTIGMARWDTEDVFQQLDVLKNN